MLEKIQVGNILKTIYDNFNIDKMVEITLECNPESITDDKMEGYSKFGINRISIGVQSLNNDILKIIGRIHDREEVFKKFKIVEKYFNNISVDMMFGLPNQEVEILKNDLEEIVNNFGKNGKLKHISVYSLILEKGTKFWNNSKIEKMLPSEDEERDMYKAAQKILNENGYIQYEISNFAKKGYESRHNVNCWKQMEYYGFGIGASSYYNGIRYTNIRGIYKYIEKYLEKIDKKDNKNSNEEKKRFLIKLNEDKIQNEYILKKGMEYIYKNYNILEIQKAEDKLREKIIIGLRMEKGIYLEKEMIENFEINKVIDKYIKLKFLKKYIGKGRKRIYLLN